MEESKKSINFALAKRQESLMQAKTAKIAQLVEHDLAKVGVAGSSPVFRSNQKQRFLIKTQECLGGGIGRRATLRG